ncbi:MAG: CcdB family protein [Proteobacteria bacterium]|nr:CcdB family protein [Pseudomonadota bacterium]
MARFDYHRAGETYLLDCQANTLGHLSTRVVAPLLPRNQVPSGLSRLHPVLTVEGRQLVLATHLLTALPTRELGMRIGSLAESQDEIMAALDMLLTGI